MAQSLGPLVTVTPLYHFSSDSPELSLGRGVYISRYDPDASFDEILTRHLQVHEPDFLLWYDPVISEGIAVDELIDLAKKEDKSLTERLIRGVVSIFLTFRLFKPGHLRGGETFVITRPEAQMSWTTMSSARASMMTVDYGVLKMLTTSYSLDAEEVPFVVAFSEAIFPVMDTVSSYPALSQALLLYSSDNGEHLDVVASITALEALLSKKEETEGLTYRLALRIANLVGSDPESRKDIFKRVKEFYSLRSKIVHGVTLDTKQRQRLNALESLREMVRRVLLSAIALYDEGIRPADLPELLDELSLDEERRKKVCATATKFLHLATHAGTPSHN